METGSLALFVIIIACYIRNIYATGNNHVPDGCGLTGNFLLFIIYYQMIAKLDAVEELYEHSNGFRAKNF